MQSKRTTSQLVNSIFTGFILFSFKIILIHAKACAKVHARYTQIHAKVLDRNLILWGVNWKHGGIQNLYSIRCHGFLKGCAYGRGLGGGRSPGRCGKLKILQKNIIIVLCGKTVKNHQMFFIPFRTLFRFYQNQIKIED